MSLGFPCTELAGQKPIPVQKLRTHCTQLWLWNSASQSASLCPGLHNRLMQMHEAWSCLMSNQPGAWAKCVYLCSSLAGQTWATVFSAGAILCKGSTGPGDVVCLQHTLRIPHQTTQPSEDTDSSILTDSLNGLKASQQQVKQYQVSMLYKEKKL